MGKRNIVFLALINCLMVAWLASCAEGEFQPGPSPGPEPGKELPSEEQPLKPLVKGEIIQKDGNRWLITAYVDNGDSPHIDAYWLTVDEQTELRNSEGAAVAAQDIMVGARVEAWTSGPLAESYPVQGKAAKILTHEETETLGEGWIGRSAAIQAALQSALHSHSEASAARAVKETEAEADDGIWKVSLVKQESVGEPIELRIDGRSGRVVLAENDAFRVFSPQPETEAGPVFTVEGAARVFEAAFSWQLEDGHGILAEGHENADGGAPAWGDFQFEVSYEKATQPNLSLILFVNSAKDGSVEKELIIPLKAPEQYIDYGVTDSLE